MSRDNLKPQTSKREGDLSFVAGGYFSHGGVFSENVEYIYLCAGPSIKVYRLENATLVGILVGHIDTVTSVLCDRSDKSNFLSSSLDGTIIVWDVATLKLKRRISVGFPIFSMVFPGGFAGADAIFISSAFTDKDVGERIWMLSYSKGKILERIAKTLRCTKLSHTSSGSFLGTFERNTVLIWAISKDLIGYGSIFTRLFKVHFTKPLTSFTFCGNKMFAVGDKKGQIICHHGFSTMVIETIKDTYKCKDSVSAREKVHVTQLPSVTLHWHSESVMSLASSADGSVLLSGGHEGVLVLWSINDGQKNFIPRLGSEICAIIPGFGDSTKFALICKDNGVRFISTNSLTIEKSIQGIFHLRKNKSSCVTIDPKTNYLVVNNSSSSIQFYDTRTDKHASDLQIGSSNSVHIKIQILHAVFSIDGSLLVTVHKFRKVSSHWIGKNKDANVEFLRFWKRSTSEHKFVTGARDTFNVECECERPHCDKVSSIKISPILMSNFSDYLVCTIGYEGQMKTWCASKNYPRKWYCRSTSAQSQGSFVNFCSDGSILSSAESDICFWNSHNLQRLFILPLFSGMSPIRSLAFASKNYFISATQSSILIWDLLSLNLVQSYAFDCRSLKKDVFSSAMLANVQFRTNEDYMIMFMGTRILPKKVYRLPSGTFDVFFTKKQSLDGNETSLLLLTTSHKIFGSNFSQEDRDEVKFRDLRKKQGIINASEDTFHSTRSKTKWSGGKGYVAFALAARIHQVNSQSLPSLVQLCPGFLEDSIVAT